MSGVIPAFLFAYKYCTTILCTYFYVTKASSPTVKSIYNLRKIQCYVDKFENV